MGKISASGLLFDMDGVLVDSEDLMMESAKAALKEWGVNAVDDDFTEFIGAGEDRFVGGVAQKYGIKYELAMKDRAYAIYAERAPFSKIAFDGAGQTLRDLKSAGFRIGICSGADRVKVDVNLHLLGLDDTAVDVVVTGSDVTKNKPAPDIYKLGLERIGLPPEKCLVIEDSLNGIEAGLAAGIRVVAVSSSFSSEELLTKLSPVAVIGSVCELPLMLSHIPVD
ncbi:MAG: HAD-IA family hydrolase [Lentisphaerae bacterium]|nr:HAD-IA family hydrolase [Lentisphaerota bacterium]